MSGRNGTCVLTLLAFLPFLTAAIGSGLRNCFFIFIIFFNHLAKIHAKPKIPSRLLQVSFRILSELLYGA